MATIVQAGSRIILSSYHWPEPVVGWQVRRGLAALLICLALFPLCACSAEEGGSVTPEATKPLGSQPVFESCELYAAGHFANYYEVMGENECRDMLAEAKYWGFNRYMDWLDTSDCSDPFRGPVENRIGARAYGLGDAQLDNKKLHYTVAQNLGFLPDNDVNPNQVYVDQCLSKLLATPGDRVQGQLICPSIPEARAVILKNYDNLFRDLSRSGVRLHTFMACPYDWGGCRCDKCKPWILTFAKLTHEVYDVARKYYPNIKVDILGWWWTPDEHRLFADWVDRNAPGWVDIMYLHMPYGATSVSKVPLPKGCKLGAFVHIGYAEQEEPADIYGHFGPVIAAQRLQKSVTDLKAQGVVAINAYSEGIFDDVNKAILGGLVSGEHQTADEVLEAYARRYFGADPAAAKLWAQWLKAWGKPFEVDIPRSAADLQTLLKKTPQSGWRLRQWELKQQLLAVDKEIGNGTDWTPERLAAVQRFWSVQEQIQRGLWGLAPQRHIFARRFTPRPWYPSWAKNTGAPVAEIGKEQ
jgi:hypothetical protein